MSNEQARMPIVEEEEPEVIAEKNDDLKSEKDRQPIVWTSNEACERMYAIQLNVIKATMNGEWLGDEPEGGRESGRKGHSSSHNEKLPPRQP